MIVQEERISMEFSDAQGPVGWKRTAAIIFDWVTGKILLVSTSCKRLLVLSVHREKPYTETSDLSFLTKDLIILTSSSLSVDGDVTLEVRSLVSGTPVFRFKLPLLASTYTIQFIKRPASRQGLGCPTSYAKLFLPDPRVDILGMVVEFRKDPMTSQRLAVLSIHQFLHRFQDIMDDVAEDGNDDLILKNEIPPSEWEQWGPPVTIWFHEWRPLDFWGLKGEETSETRFEVSSSTPNLDVY